MSQSLYHNHSIAVVIILLLFTQSVLLRLPQPNKNKSVHQTKFRYFTKNFKKYNEKYFWHAIGLKMVDVEIKEIHPLFIINLGDPQNSSENSNVSSLFCLMWLHFSFRIDSASSTSSESRTNQGSGTRGIEICSYIQSSESYIIVSL